MVILVVIKRFDQPNYPFQPLKNKAAFHFLNSQLRCHQIQVSWCG